MPPSSRHRRFEDLPAKPATDFDAKGIDGA
jgi:hypothetical protein